MKTFLRYIVWIYNSTPVATGRELPPATDSGSSPIAEDARRWRDELESGDHA